MKDEQKVKIKPSSYHPTRVELKEDVKLRLKGGTTEQRMDSLARAIFETEVTAFRHY